MFNINDVSRMLREARIQKNLTQNALADQMGVTYQAVSNWERGTSVPDISNLARLCEILELDLYKLVGSSQNRELTEELERDARTAAMAADVPTIDFPKDEEKYYSSGKYGYAR